MSNTTNIPQRVSEVYEIFQNYFSPEFVDLQEASGMNHWIMVWWPLVTVTNDNGRSIVIKDLYARILVTPEGKIPYEFRGFQLNKTTFSYDQWTSGYVHSHVPSLYYRRGKPEFADPCLGTGPINNTIMDLKNNYEEAVWMLFCRELSLYVTVESLRGGPYIKLETVGATKRLSGFERFTEVDSIPYIHYRNWTSEEALKTFLKEFTLWYLQNGHLKFNYRQERFRCGLPYYDFMIDISNSFIEWYNMFGNRDVLQRLYEDGTLMSVRVSQGKFYKSAQENRTNHFSVEGASMFMFKGEQKHLHIESPTSEGEGTVTTILHHEIAMYILGRILQIINYRYCNEHNKLPESGSTQEGTSSTYKTVFYL